jgi:CheY-like chemotaxis protein
MEVAADGAGSIKKARELKPDLIVVDLVMPAINGIEATSVIKTSMLKVPVIAFVECIRTVLGPVS